jgi:uncharacterized protein (DUF433 family)
LILIRVEFLGTAKIGENGVKWCMGVIFLGWLVSAYLANFVTLWIMELKDLISIDADVLGGQPVFKGTRVPIETLFDHLEAGVSLDEFLEDFPTVSKQQAIATLEIANKFLTAKNVATLYETAA